MTSPSKRSFLSWFFKRKSLIVPTWKGWFVILLLLISSGIGIGLYLPKFLTIHRPIGGEVLVLEGWLNDDLLEEVAVRFKEGGYKRLVTTGGPLAHGTYLKEYKNYAELSKRSLIAIGFEESLITAVPAPKVQRQRTLASVNAFKAWLKAEGKTQKFDIITLGAHSRRTFMIYEHILGEEFEIGVHALPDPRFEGRAWYRTSAGVRSLLSETIAYFYGLLFSLD